MTANDEFFTPEAIDEQIDLLSRRPGQHYEADMQAARFISHLQQFHIRNDQKHIAHLDHAWERIIKERQSKKQATQKTGRNIHMEEYQVISQEAQALKGKQSLPKKRAFVRQFSLLAAVVIVGVLVGSMVFTLNMARQAQNNKANHQVETGSDGKNHPKPPHPITGGPCTIDTTVAHQQQSKTSIPGLYVFASNNQSDNVLYRYDSHAQKVVWSKQFCPKFESNGTVEQNGILYLAGVDVTHESGSGMKSYLYALNETDGSALWGIEFPTKVIPFEKSSPNYGSSPLDLGGIETPTIANGIIYVMQRTGIVYAFDATTGGQLWTFDAGRNAWATTSHGNGSILEPSSIQVINGVAYGSIVDRVFALDARSGKELWMHSFSDKLNINQTPAIANGMIYLTAFVPGYGSVENPDTYIYAFNAQTGVQMWVTTKMRGYLNGPIALNGKPYAMSYDGTWYALNPSNGTIESQKPLANAGVGGPSVINGTLYNITDTTLFVLNPDGSTVWSVPVTGKYPFIDDVKGGIIYVSGRGSGIYAYNATNGSLLWHYEGYLPQPDGISIVTIVG